MRKLVKKSEAYFVKIGDTIVYHYDCNMEYYNNRDDIECGTINTMRIDKTNTKTIIIDPLFVNYKSKGLFFSNLAKLKKIIGLEYLNTSEITSMSYMFEGCSSLTELDLRGFNTSNVRFMVGMFFGCFKLKNINLSNFDTSNVINLSGMFYNCESLMNLDLKGFDTSNVTDMSYMFHCCKSLANLDISEFNTSKVTGMQCMFCNCKNLKTVYVGDSWNTSKVEKLEGMFGDCSNLVGGKGTTFSSEITDITRAKVDGGKQNPGYLTAKK